MRGLASRRQPDRISKAVGLATGVTLVTIGVASLFGPVPFVDGFLVANGLLRSGPAIVNGNHPATVAARAEAARLRLDVRPHATKEGFAFRRIGGADVIQTSVRRPGQPSVFIVYERRPPHRALAVIESDKSLLSDEDLATAIRHQADPPPEKPRTPPTPEGG